MAAIIARIDQKSKLIEKVLDDDEFSAFLLQLCLKRAYAQLQDAP
jgi:hypothetical protein